VPILTIDGIEDVMNDDLLSNHTDHKMQRGTVSGAAEREHKVSRWLTEFRVIVLAGMISAALIPLFFSAPALLQIGIGLAVGGLAVFAAIRAKLL
jgi:hypothetical protein